MKKEFFVVCIISFLFFLSSCLRPEKPVAKIGGEWVSFEQWQTFLKSRQVNDFSDRDKLNKAFDELIKREVAYEKAKRKGLLTGNSWDSQKEKIKINTVVYNYLLSKKLNGVSEPNEEELFEIYKIENSKRHLWGVGVKGRENAHSVAKALKEGADIETIFEQHKNDLPNLSQKYDLGYTNFNQVPKQIQKVFFNGEVEEVLDPIEIGSDGYMVVVLKELVIPPKPADYDKIVFMKAAGLKFQRAMKKINEEFKTSFPESYDKELVSELLKKEKIEQEDLNKIVGKVGSKKIDYLTLVDNYYNDLQNGVNLQQNEESFKLLFDRIASETRVYLVAEKEGFLKDSKISAEIWNKTHEKGAAICYYDFFKEYLIKDEELKEFYEKNKDQFKGEYSLKLRYLISTSPEFFKNAVNMFKNGAKWEEILKAPGILPETGNGIIDWKTEQQLASIFSPNILTKLKSLEKGKWLADRIGPERLILILLEDRKEGKIYTFEESTDKVREAYMKENGIKLFERYIEDSKKRIKVETYPQNLV